MRRRTLVDRLERRIAEAEPVEVDWLLEVEVACARQDMEWELRVWDEANATQPPSVSASGRDANSASVY